MADGGVKRAMATSSESIHFDDRLNKLYPLVDESKTPLPRSWIANHKVNHVGLSHNNLRVQYKGHGKTHRDAASVQASHPIPSTCGIYYFEVKIFSKGRDGYMGVGLSAPNVNLNRLPGWDKLSYGYHGDDGHSFCSSGTGIPYGPTFTTGDVIGCGVNLIDSTCFYTKNGHNLGIAFRDLPPGLYPTVGLQTPGEIIDANFGQEPFMFDIEDVMNEMRIKTRTEIADFPVPHITQVEWQAAITDIVSTYLIHNGYHNTAEALAHITSQPFNEDTTSIKNRQKILKLVLAGRMGEAIEKTSRLYPGLLENDENLLFMLKCRQFVEMVNGSDIEVPPTKKLGGTSPLINVSPRSNSPIQTSVIQSTKNYSNKPKSTTIDELNNQNNSVNGDSGTDDVIVIKTQLDCDVDMDTMEEVQNGHECNGKLISSNNSNGYQNGDSHETICLGDSLEDDDEDMDVDIGTRKTTKPAVERILEFGRELYNMNERLKVAQGTNARNEKMLEDVFSLLAYSNPWSSPVGWQLDQVQRERVCSSLNSAILGELRSPYARVVFEGEILESQNKPRKPSLEMLMAHAQELMYIMCNNGFGSCAFTSVSDLMEH